jgi:hypothetical protein
LRCACGREEVDAEARGTQAKLTFHAQAFTRPCSIDTGMVT